MPIIKEVPKYCHCFDKPNGNQYGAGTIWECDTCQKRFILVTSCDQREPGNYWRPCDSGTA